ncbi:unnamed protein product [Protopolystoma xenopodis]|uniref:Uncharacterized protein n=1 Tax=Protopolystoma xenopodis TaxID=117903 RepID=A0A3S5B3G1_9PLAT|nr:unnamed protein product [Protopolystoma xenopodis]
MVLRIARLIDDAEYDAGETSGNVPCPRSYSGNDVAYNGLRTRCVPLSLPINMTELRKQGQTTFKWTKLEYKKEVGSKPATFLTFVFTELSLTIGSFSNDVRHMVDESLAWIYRGRDAATPPQPPLEPNYESLPLDSSHEMKAQKLDGPPFPVGTSVPSATWPFGASSGLAASSPFLGPLGVNPKRNQMALVKLETVFFTYLWSLDLDAVLTSMSCFRLLCHEAELWSSAAAVAMAASSGSLLCCAASAVFPNSNSSAFASTCSPAFSAVTSVDSAQNCQPGSSVFSPSACCGQFQSSTGQPTTNFRWPPLTSGALTPMFGQNCSPKSSSECLATCCCCCCYCSVRGDGDSGNNALVYGLTCCSFPKSASRCRIDFGPQGYAELAAPASWSAVAPSKPNAAGFCSAACPFACAGLAGGPKVAASISEINSGVGLVTESSSCQANSPSSSSFTSSSPVICQYPQGNHFHHKQFQSQRHHHHHSCSAEISQQNHLDHKEQLHCLCNCCHLTAPSVTVCCDKASGDPPANPAGQWAAADFRLPDLMPVYAIYSEIADHSRSIITTGRAHLQKQILALLRRVNHQTQGNKLAWDHTYMIWIRSTRFLLNYPKSKASTSNDEAYCDAVPRSLGGAANAGVSGVVSAAAAAVGSVVGASLAPGVPSGAMPISSNSFRDLSSSAASAVSLTQNTCLSSGLAGSGGGCTPGLGFSESRVLSLGLGGGIGTSLLGTPAGLGGASGPISSLLGGIGGPISGAGLAGSQTVSCISNEETGVVCSLGAPGGVCVAACTSCGNVGCSGNINSAGGISNPGSGTGIGVAGRYHAVKRRTSHQPITTDHEIEGVLNEWANMTGFLCALGSVALLLPSAPQLPRGPPLQLQPAVGPTLQCHFVSHSYHKSYINPYLHLYVGFRDSQ